MRRTSLYYVWVGVLIFLANSWLYCALSTWTTSFSLQPSPALWQEGLTWLATIPQLPSLFVSKAVAEYFNLDEVGWTITTTLVSISFTIR